LLSLGLEVFGVRKQWLAGMDGGSGGMYLVMSKKVVYRTAHEKAAPYVAQPADLWESIRTQRIFDQICMEDKAFVFKRPTR